LTHRPFSANTACRRASCWRSLRLRTVGAAPSCRTPISALNAPRQASPRLTESHNDLPFTTHEVIKGKAITIKAPFRAYGSYQDAADDYASMLSSNPRFRTCFLHTSSAQFAVALARNGYATDPSYAHKLNSIIRAHKLDQYDAKGAHQ
jgi:hypothetical protein